MSDTKKTCFKKIEDGRINILYMSLMTLLNMLLIIFIKTISFPLSAYLPQLVYAIGLNNFNGTGSLFHLILGSFFSLAIISVYFLFYKLSKRNWNWIKAAFILFIVDTLVMLFFSFMASKFDISFFIDVIYHGWVLFSLYTSILYMGKIKKVKEEKPEITPQNFIK